MSQAFQIKDENHPVNILMEEHRRLLGFSEKLIAAAQSIKSFSDFNAAKSDLDTVEHLVRHLKDAEKHYLREENVLFPMVERHGIVGPPKMMWAEHDQIRELKKGLFQLLDNREDTDFADFADKLSEYADSLNNLMSSHFAKENQVLFPAAKRVLTQQETCDALAQFKDIGFCCFTPEIKLDTAEEEPLPDTKISDGKRAHFESGELLKDEIESIFNTLPLDITFIDEGEVVRYFNQPEDMIFARTKAIIGRKVQNCHPAKSVHLVNKIVEEFKAGTREVAEFWLEMKGKFIYIRYFPVRNKEGKYLGCMEVTQDVAEIKKLSGEKRLLD